MFNKAYSQCTSSISAGPLELVPLNIVTHTASGGNWSLASTWGGSVPGNGARVHIPAGITVTVDGQIASRLETIRIDGILEFATGVPTALNVDTMISSPSGVLKIGTAATPIASNVTANILFINDGPVNPSCDQAQLGRGAVLMGQTIMHGAAKTHRAILAAPALSGQSSIQLTEVPFGWQIGDEICITGTIAGNPQSDEIRMITAINGSTITLNSALNLNHQAPPAEVPLNVYVANMTRNIIFSSESTTFLHRGHMMFMHTLDVNVKYVRFHEMGRSDKKVRIDDWDFDPIEGDPGNAGVAVSAFNFLQGARTNIRGRYPCHLHRGGTDLSSTPAFIEGCVIFNAPGWGYAHHSSYAHFINNVSYGAQGTGFYVEAGDEVGSLVGNIAIRTVNPTFSFDDTNGAIDPDLFTDFQDFGTDGDGFWFTSLLVANIDNVSAGASGHGFIYWTDGLVEQDATPAGRRRVPVENVENGHLITNMTTIPTWWAPMAETRGNESYGAPIGFRARYVHNQTYLGVGGSTFHAKPPQAFIDTLQPTIDDLTVWNCRDGLLLNYCGRFSVVNSHLVGIGAPFQESGGTADTGVGLDMANVVTTGFGYVMNNIIEGYELGFAPCVHDHYVVDNLLLKNRWDINLKEPRQSPRALAMSNLTFGSLAGTAVAGQQGQRQNIRFQSNIEHDGFQPYYFVLPDHITLDGQGLYWNEQASSFVPVPSLPDQELLIIPRNQFDTFYVGASNQQMWNGRSQAYGGSLIPAGASSDPRVSGGVVGTPPVPAINLPVMLDMTNEGENPEPFPPGGPNPEITRNFLEIADGGTVIIFRMNLNSTDNNTQPAGLTYTMSGIQNGFFEHRDNPGVAITTFAQSDIDGGVIRFVHAGNGQVPNYTATLTDGSSTTPASQVIASLIGGGSPDLDPPTPNPATFSTPPFATGENTIDMVATAGSDVSLPVEYFFSRDGGVATSGWIVSTSWQDTGLNPGVQYCYTVTLRDSSGSQNVGGTSLLACATTDAPDTTPPSVPTGLASPSQTSTTIDLTWNASTDNVGVTGYDISVDSGSPIDVGNVTSYTLTGLTANTSYSIVVRAKDAAGNNSAYSSAINVSTDLPNQIAPTPNPMTFASVPTATSSTSITMTATTAIDDEGSAVEYRFRELSGMAGGASSGWQPSVNYTNSGLSPLTMYSYDVTARDALGNETVPSSSSSATTPDTPSSNILLETGVVSGVGSSWITVNLGSSYTSMVVVATPNYTNTSAPAHVRIQNASGSSFQLRVDGSATTPATQDVYYMVVEEGTYTVATDGVKMEAVKYNSTLTDNNNSWTGQARSYANSYTTPVVLGQVMTYNDAGHVTFWARGNTRQTPPNATLFTGKTVNEDPDNAHANETIGYIVIESGTGNIDGVNYSAGVGGDTIRGVTNSPPFSYSVSGLSGAASIGIATLTAMDGGNGGWALFYGANPISNSSINLAIDEDQLGDTERAHTTEQVAYIVFEDAATPPDTTPPTPNPATFASAPAAISSSAISMTATTASDPSGPVEYYFANTSPGGSGGDDSGWQTSASYTDTGLTASTNYCYTVQFRDSAGSQNTGTASTASCATTQDPPADTTPPTPNPATFASAPAAAGSFAISMTATTGSDPSGPVEYFFTQTPPVAGGSDSVWQTSPSYTDTLLTPNTSYCYTVTMRDAAGTPNMGNPSMSACATTDALPDTTPPSVPTGLASPAQTQTTIDLTWNASTDNVGVTGYDIRVDGGSPIGVGAVTSHTLTGLSAGTSYAIDIRAKDAAGNNSAYSSPAINVQTDASSGCGTGQPYTNFVGAGNAQDVVATASSNDGAANATQTINGSGLSGNTHDDGWGSTWTSDGDNGNPNAPNPNPARGNTNWISYDLGHLYKLGQMQVWNGSEIAARGLNLVSVDYSTDGTNWTTIVNNVNWPQAPSTNNGFNGPDFGGVCARYVVITVHSNHDDPFANQLAEVKFNLVP